MSSSSGNWWLRVIRGVEVGPLAALVRFGMWFLQWPYRTVMAIRNAKYDHSPQKAFRAAVPVVSVGNLSVGGTGKTVCVEWVAKQLREQGHAVTILSRGYGKSSSSSQNDEAMMLTVNLPDVPHLQGADRTLTAKMAVEELEAEVLVLDDGFQHRQLHRDLDIVLLDATQTIISQWPLPRGTYREPFSSLSRASAVILTRCDQVVPHIVTVMEAKLRRCFPRLPIARAIHAPTELVDSDGRTSSIDLLRGAKVLAFCGVGHPESFFETLRSLGVMIVESRVFPDHHQYTRHDVDRLRSWASFQHDVTYLVTTQKDLVKLQLSSLSGLPLWALRVELKFTSGEGELKNMLESLPIGSPS